MQIRQYAQKDKEQILTLFNEFGDYFVDIDKLNLIIRAENYAEVMFGDLLEDTSTNGIIYVAEENSKIIGFIGGNFKDLDSQNTVENVPMRKGRILEFFITKEFRGKGIGKKMMIKIEEFFIQNNCNTVNIEVFAQNINTYEFYKSFGYSDRNIDVMKVLKKPL